MWLCEELNLAYELKRYERDPKTMLAPPAYKALHHMGAAPVVEDGDVVLAESGAIVEYIAAKYGGGSLTLGPADPCFPDYVYWFHFANGSLHPIMARTVLLVRANSEATSPILKATETRLNIALSSMDDRLAAADFLAGSTLTLADVMTVYLLTTMRLFLSVDLAPYAGILEYLRRIRERPAYQRARQKAEPESPI